MCTNNRVHYGQNVALVYLRITLTHYYNYADVSEDIEPMNICHVHAVECVSKIKGILSIIYHTVYGAVCIQLTPFSCDECTLCCYHHHIGSMNHLPFTRLCHETMICVVCLSMFLCNT